MKTSRIIATFILLFMAVVPCIGQDSSALSAARIDSARRAKDSFALPGTGSDTMTSDVLEGARRSPGEDSILITGPALNDSNADAGLLDSVRNLYETAESLRDSLDTGRGGDDTALDSAGIALDSASIGRVGFDTTRDAAENPPAPFVEGKGTEAVKAERRMAGAGQPLQKAAADRLDKGPLADPDQGLQGKDALDSGRIQDTLMTADTSRISQAARRIPSVKGIFSFSKVFWALVLLLISYLIIRVITKSMNIVAERSARLRIWLKGLIPVFRIVAWTTVIFMIIQGIFKPNWQTILALSASVGVAIGFAAQDILKNIFGGFTVLAEKAFQVGDKIQVGEHYGEVLSIGFRSTRIRTGDDSVVTVPNAELTARPISNSNSGETNCQVVAEFYLPETIDFEKVRRIATEAAQISGFVYLNKPITVLFFHELRENVTFIKMRLKAYVLDIRYEFVFKSQMTEIVMDALRKEKII